MYLDQLVFLAFSPMLPATISRYLVSAAFRSHDLLTMRQPHQYSWISFKPPRYVVNLYHPTPKRICGLPRMIHLIAIAVTFLSILWLAQNARNKRRYPPGPKGYPIIGNAYQIELKFAWHYYTQLKEKYGLPS